MRAHSASTLPTGPISLALSMFIKKHMCAQLCSVYLMYLSCGGHRLVHGTSSFLGIQDMHSVEYHPHLGPHFLFCRISSFAQGRSSPPEGVNKLTDLLVGMQVQLACAQAVRVQHPTGKGPTSS